MARIGAIVGHPVPCIIGGNTAPIVDIMLETGTGYLVCPFETDQPAFMRKVWDRPDVRVRVNADMRIISRGTWHESLPKQTVCTISSKTAQMSAWAPAPSPTKRPQKTSVN